MITHQLSVCLKDWNVCVHLTKFDCEDENILAVSSASKVKNRKRIAVNESFKKLDKKLVKKSESDKNFFY